MWMTQSTLPAPPDAPSSCRGRFRSGTSRSTRPSWFAWIVTLLLVICLWWLWRDDADLGPLTPDEEAWWDRVRRDVPDD